MHRIGILIGSLCLAACGGGPQFAPSAAAPSPDDATEQVVRKNEKTGAMFVLSAKPFSSVAVQQAVDPAVTQFGTSFHIRIINGTGSPAEFSLDSIAVRQAGKPLRLVGADEAKAKVAANNRTMQAMGAATMLLGGLSQSIGGVATTAAQAMSQAATQMSMQVTSMAMTSSANDARAFDDQASKVYVGAVTIPPGSETKGVFSVANVESGKPIEIDVGVGSDLHRISFVPK
jgi:hypothetical protein